MSACLSIYTINTIHIHETLLNISNLTWKSQQPAINVLLNVLWNGFVGCILLFDIVGNCFRFGCFVPGFVLFNETTDKNFWYTDTANPWVCADLCSQVAKCTFWRFACDSSTCDHTHCALMHGEFDETCSQGFIENDYAISGKYGCTGRS